MNILVVLGSPNSHDGTLSDIAISRLDKAIASVKKDPSAKLLLTGGFGEHFNTSDKPHYLHARNYLTGKIPDECVLPEYVDSNNTVSDVIMAKPILDKYNPDAIIFISSEFHIPRVKFIVDQVIGTSHKTSFISSETPSTLDIDKLQKHELKAIERLKKSGFRHRAVL